MTNLTRFHILKDDNEGPLEEIDYPILLNLDHIVSVKPIKIMYQGNIINGHWIRTVNNKKYRATRIPNELKEALNDEKNLSQSSINREIDQLDPEVFMEQ